MRQVKVNSTTHNYQSPVAMELSEEFDSSTFPGWINVVSLAKIDMAMNKTHSTSSASTSQLYFKFHKFKLRSYWAHVILSNINFKFIRIKTQPKSAR